MRLASNSFRNFEFPLGYVWQVCDPQPASRDANRPRRKHSLSCCPEHAAFVMGYCPGHVPGVSRTLIRCFPEGKAGWKPPRSRVMVTCKGAVRDGRRYGCDPGDRRPWPSGRTVRGQDGLPDERAGAGRRPGRPRQSTHSKFGRPCGRGGRCERRAALVGFRPRRSLASYSSSFGCGSNSYRSLSLTRTDRQATDHAILRARGCRASRLMPSPARAGRRSARAVRCKTTAGVPLESNDGSRMDFMTRLRDRVSSIRECADTARAQGRAWSRLAAATRWRCMATAPMRTGTAIGLPNVEHAGASVAFCVHGGPIAAQLPNEQAPFQARRCLAAPGMFFNNRDLRIWASGTSR
jgi:hypothetical protein